MSAGSRSRWHRRRTRCQRRCRFRPSPFAAADAPASLPLVVAATVSVPAVNHLIGTAAPNLPARSIRLVDPATTTGEVFATFDEALPVDLPPERASGRAGSAELRCRGALPSPSSPGRSPSPRAPPLPLLPPPAVSPLRRPMHHLPANGPPRDRGFAPRKAINSPRYGSWSQALPSTICRSPHQPSVLRGLGATEPLSDGRRRRGVGRGRARRRDAAHPKPPDASRQPVPNGQADRGLCHPSSTVPRTPGLLVHKPGVIQKESPRISILRRGTRLGLRPSDCRRGIAGPKVRVNSAFSHLTVESDYSRQVELKSQSAVDSPGG